MLTADMVVAASPVPLPRPRPTVAAPPIRGTAVAPRSDAGCSERLASIAVFQPSPSIKGPGACEADDVVRLVSISTSDVGSIKVSPPALLRCGMAEGLALWLRLASEVAKRDFGDAIVGITTATSFDCRGQNGSPNAKLSQHGLANAVDVQSLMFRDGRMLALTDAAAPMRLRASLHDLACKSFTTVLGPGSDGYHEDHIHLDLAERRGGYRICQWEVRELQSP
jgi:hypothetical protein